MISILFVVLGFSIVSSGGFLLDGSTKSPQGEIVMSNSHFTTLMKLFLEERESREQLQNFVLRLQQELTSKVDSVGNCNCKGADITDELKNNTYRLQTELDFLRKDFNTLQLQCAQFDKRLSTTENTTGRLQHDIDGVKQLKGVGDLQAVFNLENKTNQLEVKVQNTEQSIQTILSSANARSQDIIGLLNRIKATDNMTLHLESELQLSNGRLNTVVSNINGRLNTVVSDINSRNQDVIALVNNVQHLQSGLNDTVLKLDRITNRAVLSAQTAIGTVSTSAIIPFKQVRTSHGITDLKSIRNEGKFTCEKAGLYLISVVVSTASKSDGYYLVFKNKVPIAQTFRHQHSSFITSTIILTERLQTNDTVYIKNGPQMYVFGGIPSTFVIIQIG